MPATWKQWCIMTGRRREEREGKETGKKKEEICISDFLLCFCITPFLLLTCLFFFFLACCNYLYHFFSLTISLFSTLSNVSCLSSWRQLKIKRVGFSNAEELLLFLLFFMLPFIRLIRFTPHWDLIIHICTYSFIYRWTDEHKNIPFLNMIFLVGLECSIMSQDCKKQICHETNCGIYYNFLLPVIFFQYIFSFPCNFLYFDKN